MLRLADLVVPEVPGRLRVGPIPFGPCLAAGGVVAVFAGSARVLRWLGLA